MSDSYLIHYGVKGMKWGIRKEYAPHPRQSSSSSKTPQSQKSSKRTTADVSYGSTKSKTVSALMFALAVLSPIPIVQVANLASMANTSVRAGMERTHQLIEKEFTIKKKEKEFTAKQDQKAVNPGFTGLGGSTSNNCSNCTMAYELRRRGYDVKAKGLYGGRLMSTITKMFGEPEVKVLSAMPGNNPLTRGKEIQKTLMSDLSKYPNGARGAITIQYRQGGGHIFNWEVNNGKPTLIDTQNYGSNPDRLLSKIKPESLEYFRTDDANINFSLTHEAVQNRK